MGIPNLLIKSWRINMANNKTHNSTKTIFKRHSLQQIKTCQMSDSKCKALDSYHRRIRSRSGKISKILTVWWAVGNWTKIRCRTRNHWGLDQKLSRSNKSKCNQFNLSQSSRYLCDRRNLFSRWKWSKPHRMSISRGWNGIVSSTRTRKFWQCCRT